MFNYVQDPREIYRRSFETVRKEVDLSTLPVGTDVLVERLIHACGMPDVIKDFTFGGNPALAGRKALSSGANVIMDSEMVHAGIIKSRLPGKTKFICNSI